MECAFCVRDVSRNTSGTFTKHKGWVYSTTMKAAGPILAYAHNTCIQEADLYTNKPRSRLSSGTRCHFCDELLYDRDKPRMLTTAWLPSRGLRVHLPAEALGWAHNDCINAPAPQESLF